MGMLMLNRLMGESVIIGDGEDLVKIVVVEARDGKARLGFIAPKKIPIHREEVYKQIKAKEAT
jgi:carbon storage regulator